MERTFVMIKPDGVSRGLMGEIIRRIERRGLKISGMRMVWIDRELAEKLYEIHKDKPFFESIISFITSSPVLTMVVEGKDVVKVVRDMIGSTDPKDALTGTIRGDFAIDVGRNVIHAADSLENAEREISLFFTEEEIYNYRRTDDDWLYEV
ncbi:MAG: nucleoside-diphosphate kinase [Candidatus Hydrothermarchaeota archaeon]